MLTAMRGAVALAPASVRGASSTRRSAVAPIIPRTVAVASAFGPSPRGVRLSAPRRPSRVVLARCAPPPSSAASAKKSADEEPPAAPALSADEGDAAAALTKELEELEELRLELIEKEAETKKKEEQQLAKQEDLELVAQTQAQLAAKAWEDHAEWEESVVRAQEKSDAAVEKMGEAQILIGDLKKKQKVLEIALAAECGGDEDVVKCVDDALEAELEATESKGGKADAKAAPEPAPPPPKPPKKSEQWWLTEELAMEDAVPVIAERIAEAEEAYEKAVSAKASREEKHTEAVKSAEEAKAAAEAADQRASDAMAVVEQMMEEVLAARVAWSEAEEEIRALDERREKLTSEAQKAAEKAAKKAAAECPPEDEECLDALVEATVVETIEGGADAAAAAAEAAKEKAEAEEKERAEAEEKEKEKAESEAVAASVPKPQGSSKQIASKFFTSSEDKAQGTSLAAGIALAFAFFAGMLLPSAQPVRHAVASSVAQVTATIDSGYKSIVANIPESERKLAEHALEEAHEAGLLDALVLLFTSIFAVTLVSKIPGGSPVLGFLVGGAVVGPYMLGIVDHVAQAKVLAEFGVVFLLFNIGLELSYERLQSMARFIFGMGSMQMLLTTVGIAAAATACGLTIPQAVVVGMGLAFSSTAVALQVLQDRGETGARHGRATFSVLLFQDLTVVLVFMLVPLLAGPDSGSITAIFGSLVKAIFKTVVAIGAIMVAGRAVLRPIYKRIAKLRNSEVLTATTLFTALGTSLLTQSLGLSMALGAFLAGLLLAETEFHLQVESDIAPFRGLLLGLFFMTVGMQIDPGTLFANFGSILGIAVGLLAVKMGVMAVCGPAFGLSMLASLRSGVYVAPGGEFAFVTFGLAASAGLLSMSIVNQINLAVVLTMAATPLLANVGVKLKDFFKSEQSVASLQAKEGDASDLNGHVIVAGYGRVGKMIGELLNEQLIPYVGLDVSADIVSTARASDLPVYFGDAGSDAVLHAVGAEKASCAVVTVDSPGGTYRTVWALKKHYPHIKVYARATDVAQGLELERAGARAVVPETLEPSLQLGAAILGEMEMSNEDISIAVDTFRRSHMGELQMLAANSGSALGYGLPTDLQSIDLDESMDVDELTNVASA
jgi:monovalent cation:proton antiporter-2 (CPA2) family protein